MVGQKESGSFKLRYRNEETRNQWEQCLRNLKTNEMNFHLSKNYVIHNLPSILMIHQFMITMDHTTPLLNHHNNFTQGNNDTTLPRQLIV